MWMWNTEKSSFVVTMVLTLVGYYVNVCGPRWFNLREPTFSNVYPLSNMRPEICLCKPPEIWHDWAWIKRGWCVCKDPVIIIILIDYHSWPDLMKNAWIYSIHLCWFLKCKPIRPLSVQNLPPCENTLQLVRNAQLAAGAGGGVWSKPPEKCRCCYCSRSDRRRSAADAGAEQSSTGTTNHHQNLRSARLTVAGASASGVDEVV